MEQRSAPDPSVLVVGAGPTGLLLAGELRRRGVDCLLVDAFDAPLGWDRATVIHPRSLQIFESLGVVDEFLAAGVHATGARFFSDGDALGGLDFTANLTRYPFNLGLSEETTERILTAHLGRHSGAVTRSTRLVGLRPGAGSVTAVLEAHGERREVTASWVVGCDGYRSTVRELAGIPFLGDTPDEPWAVFDATFVGTGLPPEIITCFYDDPLVILTPLPGGWFRVYTRPETRETDLAADVHGVLERYRPGIAYGEVRNPMRFLCHARVAERFRAGRVLLAGDAAHACSPTQGHGMNTGLQDAFNLGWKLALVCRGEAGDVLLDSYEAERRPVAVRIVDSGVATDATLVRLEAAARAARNAEIRAVFADPDAVHAEAVAGAELDRDYRGSPVVLGAEAGRLLPRTAPVRLPDGSTPLLHELTDRSGHTALVLAGPAAGGADVTAVLDRLATVPGRELVDAAYGFVVGRSDDARVGSIDPETAARLGVDRLTVLLVRPDRYVGMRRDAPGGADGTAEVADYLATLAA